MQTTISQRELIPGLYAINLLKVLTEQGKSVHSLLHKAGLSIQKLRNSDQLFHIPVYISLLESVLAESDIPGFGLRVGTNTKLREHGILGYALLSSVNLRQALQRGTRYIHLTGCLLNLKLIEKNANTEIRISPRPNWSLSIEAERYLIEEYIGNMLQLGDALGIKTKWIENITFSYPKPSYEKLYLKQFNCPVYFDQQATIIKFIRDALDSRVEFTNTQFSTLCETECELLLKDIQLNVGLTAKVHRFLMFSPGKIPTMDEAAHALSMSVRTLRRHLHRENTTYQEIVSEFRLTLAKSYLTRTTLPAAEIAILVGYSEAVNFYRAFKQRFTMSTKEFREIPLMR